MKSLAFICLWLYELLKQSSFNSSSPIDGSDEQKFEPNDSEESDLEVEQPTKRLALQDSNIPRYRKVQKQLISTHLPVFYLLGNRPPELHYHKYCNRHNCETHDSRLLPNSVLHQDPVVSSENSIYVPQFRFSIM